MSGHPQVITCTCPTDCPVPHNVWIAAGTPLADPYPCRCDIGRRCTRICPCAGRTDTAHLPDHCCSSEDR